MSTKQIVETFEIWRASRRKLAMVTVVATEGSTYTKPGHRILIAEGGEYVGLVSGGCLEGDVGHHAEEVISTGRAQIVTYDMRDGTNDELFGLGIGCNGLIRVLIQRLDSEGCYEPFASVASRLLGRERSIVGTIVASSRPDTMLGATMIADGDDAMTFGLPEELEDLLQDECCGVSGGGSIGIESHETASGKVEVLCTVLKPVPRLLVLGAGPDAIPLVNLASMIGWRVTLLDHRSAYVEGDHFSSAEAVHLIEPSKIGKAIDFVGFDAAVVMNHHIATDRTHLRQLAKTSIPFIGLLGPVARRDRILSELGDSAACLRERLRGPVGLDIGADSPESIALSIMAEISAMTAAGCTEYSSLNSPPAPLRLQ